ncbi:MAG: hypothetical protein ABH829_03135 [archaeon]
MPKKPNETLPPDVYPPFEYQLVTSDKFAETVIAYKRAMKRYFTAGPVWKFFESNKGAEGVYAIFTLDGKYLAGIATFRKINHQTPTIDGKPLKLGFLSPREFSAHEVLSLNATSSPSYNTGDLIPGIQRAMLLLVEQMALREKLDLIIVRPRQDQADLIQILREKNYSATHSDSSSTFYKQLKKRKRFGFIGL